MIPKFLTHEAADEITARETQLQAWIDTIRDKRTGWASYASDEKPSDIPDVTNEERSMLEVYNFCKEPPEKYFAYVAQRKEPIPGFPYEDFRKVGTITTFPGDTLGYCQLGNKIHDNFGGYRYPIWVTGINGVKYFGYYYASSGDYCRIKKVKN
jgi:hypothetical protein